MKALNKLNRFYFYFNCCMYVIKPLYLGFKFKSDLSIILPRDYSKVNVKQQVKF